MDKVSIIIPTYNRAHCVHAAIDSVVAQTYENWEIILVDDGSTDDTQPMIERRYGSEPRLRYYRQHNRGVAAARNYGLKQASGELIAFLDSDDLWLPWKLELQTAVLAALPDVGMAWTDMAATDATGTVVHDRYIRIMYTAYQRATMTELFSQSQPLSAITPLVERSFAEARVYRGELFSRMISGSLVHTSTVVLRRTRFEKVRAFNEALAPSGEDFDFHLRTCREGPVAFIDVPSITYQTGMPDQLTAPAYKTAIARNYLRTIEPLIEADRQRIQLSAGELNAIRADGHRWLAERLLAAGEIGEARRSIVASLRYRPSGRAFTDLTLCLFPAPAVKRLLALRKGIKRCLRSFT